MSERSELPVSRATLDALPRERLAAPTLLKPAIWRVGAGGATYVVKDVSQVPWPCAWTARWLMRRERRSLERVADMPTTPTLLGAIDRDALLLTDLSGRALTGNDVRRAPRELAGAIVALATEFHRRGVFHLDLHARGNILVDERGRLSVIDFGAALAPGRLARRLFGGLLAAVDRQAPLKYLARYVPEALSEHEARSVLCRRRLRLLWPFNRPSRTVARGAQARLRGRPQDLLPQRRGGAEGGAPSREDPTGGVEHASSR